MKYGLSFGEWDMRRMLQNVTEQWDFHSSKPYEIHSRMSFWT